MRPSDVDPTDPLTQFTTRHLPLLIAVVGRAVPDRALAFDIAGEAVARAFHGLAPPDEPDHAGDEADEPRLALEAVEHVFGATLAHGRVPLIERRHTRDPQPARLSEQARAGIVALVREPLPQGSAARQSADALARHSPNADALRAIRGSGLVHADPALDRHLAAQPPQT